MLDHGVAGAGAVDGDQQVVSPPRGDRGDRGVDDRDMIGRRVRARVAAARQDREQFPGIVTPRGKWMKPIAALEVPRRALLVRVGADQGGVDADHDHRTEIAVGGARRWDPPVPGRDQLPHPFPGPVPGHRDPRQRRIVDLVQRPPHRRDRRDRPEHPRLIAQHPRIGEAVGAVGDRDRHVAQHRAPVVGHLRARQRRRQRAGQPGRVGQHPRDHVPACEATSSPRTSTRRFFDHSLISCICQVRFPLDHHGLDNHDYP